MSHHRYPPKNQSEDRFRQSIFSERHHVTFSTRRSSTMIGRQIIEAIRNSNQFPNHHLPSPDRRSWSTGMSSLDHELLRRTWISPCTPAPPRSRRPPMGYGSTWRA